MLKNFVSLFLTASDGRCGVMFDCGAEQKKSGGAGMRCNTVIHVTQSIMNTHSSTS